MPDLTVTPSNRSLFTENLFQSRVCNFIHVCIWRKALPASQRSKSFCRTRHGFNERLKCSSGASTRHVPCLYICERFLCAPNEVFAIYSNGVINACVRTTSERWLFSKWSTPPRTQFSIQLHSAPCSPLDIFYVCAAAISFHALFMALQQLKGIQSWKFSRCGRELVLKLLHS
jgi:hypothetical protein